MQDNVTGVILAGGESTRFPGNKCLAEVGGMPTVERAVSLFRRVVGRVIICTNCPELFFRFGCPMVGDILTERGPMTGLLSAMTASPAEWFLVAACDMPFIQEGLVRCLISVDRGEDAVVPVFGSHPQPLLALYHRRLIPLFCARISEGKKGLRFLLDEIDVAYVDERRVREQDPEGTSFLNINTMGDLNHLRGGLKC